MFGKKSLLLASAVVVGLSGYSVADTITVHDISQDVSTGTYVYSVTFDSKTNAQTNDGFVIYDFNDLTSWSFSGDLASSQFALTQTLTSNTLNMPGTVDGNGLVTSIVNGLPFDNTTVMNLSFDYVGPPNPFLGAANGILTLTSAKLGETNTSVVSTIDHSGPDTTTPYSTSANPVTVPGFGAPNFTPLPSPALAGGVLFGLIGLGRFIKARRFEA